MTYQENLVMCSDKTVYIESQYYIGPERRHAHTPRRTLDHMRRHRTRNESLISDCRIDSRRKEDDEGFFEISTLYETENNQGKQ